jgi:hypothetical protein
MDINVEEINHKVIKAIFTEKEMTEIFLKHIENETNTICSGDNVKTRLLYRSFEKDGVSEMETELTVTCDLAGIPKYTITTATAKPCEVLPARPDIDRVWKKFTPCQKDLYLKMFNKGDWLIVWNKDRVCTFTVPAMKCTLEKELDKLCVEGYWWIWYNDNHADLLMNNKWLDCFEFETLPEFDLIYQYGNNIHTITKIVIESRMYVQNLKETHLKYQLWMPNTEDRFNRLNIENSNPLWITDLMIGVFRNQLGANVIIKDEHTITIYPPDSEVLVVNSTNKMMVVDKSVSLFDMQVL